MSTAKNLLIVESPNDAAFLEAMLQTLGMLDDTSLVTIEHLHKFLMDDGSERRGKTAVGDKLSSIQSRIGKDYPDLERIGIILDFDNPPDWDEERNLSLINQALSDAFEAPPKIEKEADFVSVSASISGTTEKYDIKVACFFIKDSSGEGNLDTLLYEIRRDPTVQVPYADCLDLWRECVNSSDSQIKVSDNQFKKQWVQHFLRAQAKSLGKGGKQILSDFEQKQSDLLKNYGANMFDFNHISMIGLRDFLLLFENN